MHINPSSDPYFRHRNKYTLGQKKRRRWSGLFFWLALFIALLIAASYYGYDWLKINQLDLKSLMADFKSQQSPSQDIEKQRLADPDDVSRQALKPSNPQNATVRIPNLGEDAAAHESTSNSAQAQTTPDTETLAISSTLLGTISTPTKNIPPASDTSTAQDADEKAADSVETEATSTTPIESAAEEETASADTSEQADTTTDSSEDIPQAATPPAHTETAVESQQAEAKAEDSVADTEQEDTVTAATSEDSEAATTSADTAEVVDSTAPQAEVETAEAPADIDLESLDVKTLRQQAMQHIEAGELEAAFTTYQVLNSRNERLASPVLDSIFLGYQTQVEQHLHNNDLDQALQVRQQMQQLSAEHVSVNAALDAIMEYQKNRMTKVLKRQRLIGKTPNASSLFKSIKQLAPEHPITQELQLKLLRALLKQATQQMKQHKYTTPAKDNAFSTYQAVLELVPGHMGAYSGLQRLAEKYEAITRAHLKKNRYSSALKSIRRGEKVLPKYPAWKKLRQQVQNRDDPKYNLLNRARAQLKAGRLTRPPGDNAYETYQILAQKYPNDPYAKSGVYAVADRYVELAQAKQQAGDMQGSMALINEGLAIVPKHASLLKLKKEVLSTY